MFFFNFSSAPRAQSRISEFCYTNAILSAALSSIERECLSDSILIHYSDFTFFIARPTKKWSFFDEYGWKSDPKIGCRVIFCPFFDSALHNKLQLPIFTILTSFLIPVKAQVNPSMMIVWRKLNGGPNWGPYQTQNPVMWLKCAKNRYFYVSWAISAQIARGLPIFTN